MRVSCLAPGFTVLMSCLCLLPCNALYWEDRHYELYDTATVNVTQTSPSHHRGRRSSNILPTTIDATISIRGSDIRLRLRRNVLANWNIPVFTLRRGRCVQQDTGSFMAEARSGFYQHWPSGSSFYVSRPYTHLQAFDLEGPLMVNGSAFLLSPSRELVAMHAGARAHQLKRLLTVLHFEHDIRDERTMEERQRRAQRAQIRRARRQEMTRIKRRSRRGSRRHRLTGGRREPRRQEVSRERRQTPVIHTVELTIVADYKIFERFLRFAKDNRERALSEMKLYYIFMTNLMDIRYASVTSLDPSLIIRIALVSLVVTDVREEAVWTEGNRFGEDSVNAERALYTFRDWLRANSNIPRADHWMLFSGYDLAESSGTVATIGIAFIGTLCTDSAVSVVEEYFTATTGAVSAHELGHSLDADHDAMYRHCSDEDSHVMSTIATFPREESRASNPWQFSPCSVDAFGAYLDTVQCASHPPPKSISTHEVGGLYLDADEQCELAMGPESYFCRTVQNRLGNDLMCRRTYCYLPDDPGYCSSIVPQEYTVCDSNMWCERGRCVFHPDAPSTVPRCPQGDDKNHDCPSADCSDTKVKDAFCCATCAQRRGITVSAGAILPGTLSPGPSVAQEEFQPATSTATPLPPATVRASTSPPLLVVDTTTTVDMATRECQDLACQCQRDWSLYCLLLPYQ